MQPPVSLSLSASDGERAGVRCISFFRVAEIQSCPALTQDEAVRVCRDLLQRLEVARVLRPVNGGGQLVNLKAAVSPQISRISPMELAPPSAVPLPRSPGG